MFVIKNGLRWRASPPEYGPHKTIYNRFIRWSRLGVFNKIFAALAHKGRKPERVMIDATHLKAGASHRREPFKKPVAGWGPPVAVETGLLVLTVGGERPWNFWWW